MVSFEDRKQVVDGPKFRSQLTGAECESLAVGAEANILQFEKFLGGPRCPQLETGRLRVAALGGNSHDFRFPLWSRDKENSATILLPCEEEIDLFPISGVDLMVAASINCHSCQGRVMCLSILAPDRKGSAIGTQLEPDNKAGGR